MYEQARSLVFDGDGRKVRAQRTSLCFYITEKIKHGRACTIVRSDSWPLKKRRIIY